MTRTLEEAVLCRIVLSTVVSIRFFFFFQAEDGIRDYKVTGVQTCALPILCADISMPSLWVSAIPDMRVCLEPGPTQLRHATDTGQDSATMKSSLDQSKIGRASCRERV